MIPITCNAVRDILALATLVIDVARALKDAHGSASEYRAFVDELNAIHTMLISAARAAEDSVDRGLRDQVIREVDRCGDDIQRALARVAKFSILKSDGVAAGGLRVKMKRQWYKVDWRLLRRDEAQTVRKELAMSTQRLTTLLVLSEADGAMRFREDVMRQMNASIARDTRLLRAVETNKVHLRELESTHRRDHAFVQELFASVPYGIDSRTAAIAVLCAAVCSLHAAAPYDHVVPTALLLIAIHLLSKSSERHQRALVQDVGYSTSNAVTLIDALDRRFDLPVELCGTYDLLHSTLVGLFSRMDSSWFVATHRYQIRLSRPWTTTFIGTSSCCLGPSDGYIWPFYVVPGVKIELRFTVNQVLLLYPGCELPTPCVMCPVCCSQVLCAPCGDYISADEFFVDLFCRTCGMAFGCKSGFLQHVYLKLRRLQWGSFHDSDGFGIVGHWKCLPQFRQMDYSSALQTQLRRHGTSDHHPSSDMQDFTLSWETLFRGLVHVDIDIYDDTSGAFFHGIHTSIHVPERQDQRWLLSAIQNGHQAIAAKLLSQGVDINSCFISGYTTLHLASFRGQVEIMQLLVDHGVSITASAENDITPLACAVGQRQRRAVTFLIERGALARASRAQQLTMLYMAAGVSDIDMIRALLDNGLHIDASLQNDGISALCYAARSRQYDAVRFLLNVNHSIEPLVYSQLLALLRVSDTAICSLLFAWEGEDGRTAASMISSHPGGLEEVLNLTIHRGDNYEVVRYMLNLGANPNAEVLSPPWIVQRDAPWNALHCASYEGRTEFLKMLLEHGADVNARTRDNDSPLSLALKGKVDCRSWRGSNYDAIINELLSWGATVDERSALLLQKEAKHRRQVYLSRNPRNFVALPGAWPDPVE